MTPAERAQRAIRKQWVFHVMYGTHPNATPVEMVEWRLMAAEYINGQRALDDTPVSLEAFRGMVAA